MKDVLEVKMDQRQRDKRKPVIQWRHDGNRMDRNEWISKIFMKNCLKLVSGWMWKLRERRVYKMSSFKNI
jgi:hypothetical protein